MTLPAEIGQRLPDTLREAVLAEGSSHSLAAARRMTLLDLLWHESHLSGAGLMARTQALLHRGCFGRAALAGFRRDMRALRRALAAAGYELKFSRRPGLGGYYIPGRPELAPELAASLDAAIRDVDPRQIQIASRLSPADRVRQASQLSDGLRMMAVRRLMAERPQLTMQEAQREVLHRYYRLGG